MSLYHYSPDPPLFSLSELNFYHNYNWAIACHDITGCTYAGYSYKLHIDAVIEVGKTWCHLLEREWKWNILSAIACHDVMEDCRITYNDLVKWFGNSNSGMADWVYNVTNELGKNREERAFRTYPKIKNCKYSLFIKMCDRVANVRFSRFSGSDMFTKYCSEYPKFRAEFYNSFPDFDEFWKELDEAHHFSTIVEAKNN